MLRTAKKRPSDNSETSPNKGSQKVDFQDELQPVLGSKSKSRRKDPSEELLENLVFGQHIDDGEAEDDELDSGRDLDEGDSSLPNILRGEENDSESDEDDDQVADTSEIERRIRESDSIIHRDGKKPAWHDDTDDVNLSFKQEKSYRQTKIRRTAENEVSGKQLQSRLKSQYEKVVGSTPSWAKLKSERDEEKDSDSSDEDDDEDVPLLRHTGDYLTTSQQLPSNTINIKRLTNLNKEQPTEGKVTSVEFHPGAQVAMVAGLDQRLNLFQVEGRLNPKIQSVFMEQFPIKCAHFSSQGSEVVLTGKRRWFYVYDMIAGKITQIPSVKGIQENKLTRFEVSPDNRFLAFIGDYGNIHLLSSKTKEIITTLKMNGSVEAITFTPDGEKMLSFGDDCDVYVWDMNTRDCVHKFSDSGCIKGTTISVSNGNQYVATGSKSGVVNIYDDQCLTKANPTPIKAIMNLTTPVTATKFNPSNEILAATSFFSRDIVKMVHLPTCHTFHNFPPANEVLKAPCAIDFSPRGGFFALGNNKGEVPLFRLKHYSEY